MISSVGVDGWMDGWNGWTIAIGCSMKFNGLLFFLANLHCFVAN